MSTLLFEGEDLGVLRERVRAEVGASARIVRAGRVRRGGFAGFFVREAYQLEVETDHRAGATTGGATTPEEQAEAVEDPVLVDFAAAASVAAPAGPAGAERARAPLAPTEHAMGSFEAELASVVGAGPGRAATPARRPERVPPGASRGRLGSSSREKPVQVPATAGPLTTGTLAVARLPGPGTAALVAVVGELPEVAVSASEVAAGLDGAEVTKLPLPGPPGADPTRPQVLRPLAALLRRRLRGLPSVMVVPVRRWGADFEQVEHVIGALRPDFLLAVVPASAKPEDVTSWCGRLGGADALAVVGAAHTTTPSTCLSAGVPIASIDGQAPGRADLAALVAERTVG